MENELNNSKTGRIAAGLFLVGIGVVLLIDRLGAGLPGWVFSWPMILITIGAFLGLRHRFRGGAWVILMVIGFIFLFDMISPDYSLRRYFWPIMIMVIGLIMILKPRGSRSWGGRNDWRRHNMENDLSQPIQPANINQPLHETQFKTYQETKSTHATAADYLDSAAIFGGVRKAFFTKDFKGGEALSVFGGQEIDLSKSDIQGTVQLELTQIFGGTKLIVPNNWNIKSEVVAFLGGIEDKRHTDAASVDPGKILLLKGTSILGGIDIRSY
jgi:predicted membrane protein